MKYLNSYKNFENMESDSMRREKCDRCGQPPIDNTTTMSKFNKQVICMPCKEKEQKHPKYRTACDAEEEAIRNGDFNYPGLFDRIGLPEGL